MRPVSAILVASLWFAAPPAASAAESGSSANQPAPATDVQGSGDLSDKLSDTNGVIHPKQDVDPAIRTAPPDTGVAPMPVIPPPGSPGGDPAVKPK